MRNSFRKKQNIVYMQSRISRTPYPPIGWEHAVTGAYSSVPSPLSSPKKTSNTQTEIWSTRNQWSRRPFERKVLIHYSYFGFLFKARYFNYNCCWGTLWKQSSLLIHHSCCWAPLKAMYFTHYSCYWGPLWKRSEPTYTLHLLLRALLKA